MYVCPYCLCVVVSWLFCAIVFWRVMDRAFGMSAGSFETGGGSGAVWK